jgi:TPP-dependent pyruvate/acetoin dehydrogenase alpha subunit
LSAVSAAAEAGSALALLRVRIGQLLVNRRLKAGEIKVPVHLALGHEAIAVATAEAMSDGDPLLLTHRNIHYNLARAAIFSSELDELLLKPSGVAQGQLGSMNMANPKAGIVYTSSILGNSLCVGAGVALAALVNANDSVAFIVTGDGALEEGAFYESLEFLKSFNLRAVLIVENNGWSMATRIEERRCPIDLSSLAAAFGAPYAVLGSNDVFEYVDALQAARARAKNERTPVILEVALKTLGDRWMKPDGGDERYINYHHGVAHGEEEDGWPFLRATADDPLHVLAGRIGESTLMSWAKELRAALEKEVG